MVIINCSSNDGLRDRPVFQLYLEGKEVKVSKGKAPTTSPLDDSLPMYCAWCIEEDGEEAQEGHSHGICDGHATQVQIAYQWSRLQRTPSYFERFKDGRANWEDED